MPTKLRWTMLMTALTVSGVLSLLVLLPGKSAAKERSMDSAPPSAAGSSGDGSGSAIQYKSDGIATGPTTIHKDWKLLWEDDFSKDREIDKSKWNFEIDGKGGGNHELEYYTDSPRNACIENGELVITALKADAGHRFSQLNLSNRERRRRSSRFEFALCKNFASFGRGRQ